MVYQPMRQDEIMQAVNVDKTEKNKKREREKRTWPEAWEPSAWRGWRDEEESANM